MTRVSGGEETSPVCGIVVWDFRSRGLAVVQLSEHNGATALCVIIIIADGNQWWLTEWLRPKTGTRVGFP